MAYISKRKNGFYLVSLELTGTFVPVSSELNIYRTIKVRPLDNLVGVEVR